MVERIDKAVELVARAKKDRKTLVLSIGSLIAFTVAVGAISVYEHMTHKLKENKED